MERRFERVDLLLEQARRRSFGKLAVLGKIKPEPLREVALPAANRHGQVPIRWHGQPGGDQIIGRSKPPTSFSGANSRSFEMLVAVGNPPTEQQHFEQSANLDQGLGGVLPVSCDSLAVLAFRQTTFLANGGILCLCHVCLRPH